MAPAADTRHVVEHFLAPIRIQRLDAGIQENPGM
jgi:hypothetical protein